MDSGVTQHVLILSDSESQGKRLASLIRQGIESPLKIEAVKNEDWKRSLNDNVDIVIILSSHPLEYISKLLFEINDQAPDVPILVISKEMGLEDSKKLLESGVLKVFNKKSKADEIISGVKDTLALASKGFISGVGLPVALQMLELERKTCTLTVKTNGQKGLLFFKNGELIEAQVAQKKGLQAALEIASWNEVELEFRNFCKPSKRSIDMPLAFILLEASRQKDEANSDDAGEETPLSPHEVPAEPEAEPVINGIDELDFDLEQPRYFNLEQEMQEGPLANPLQKIQNALARAIGPIAKTIFKQNAEAWAKDSEPTLENIDQLIDMLCVEIEDDELIEEFRRELGL